MYFAHNRLGGGPLFRWGAGALTGLLALAGVILASAAGGTLADRFLPLAGGALVGVAAFLIYRAHCRGQFAQSGGQAALERFGALLDTVPYGVVEVGLDGTIRYANPAACRMRGLGVDALIGGNALALFNLPEHVEETRDLVRGALRAGGEPKPFRGKFRHADGRIVSYQADWAPATGPDGGVIGYVAALTDLTQTLRHLRALQRREREYRALAENGPDLMVRLDREDRIAFANARFLGHCGIAPEPPGATPSGLRHPLPPGILASWREALDATRRSGAPCALPMTLAGPGGPRHYQVRFIPEPAEENRPAAVLVIAADVTDLRAAVDDVDRKTRRMEAVLASAQDGIVSIDEEGVVQLFNAAAETVFGYRAAEVLGRNVSLLMPATDAAMHDGYIRRYLETGEARVLGIGREVTGRRKDGVEFPLFLAVAECDVDGRREFVGTVNDLTALRQAERALERSEGHHTLAQRAANIASWDWDLASGRVEWSGPVAGMLGEALADAPLSGPELLRRVHPDDRRAFLAAVRRCLRGPGELRVEHRVRRADGESRWLLELGASYPIGTGRPTRMLGIVMDITEGKRVEAELREAKRLAEEASEARARFISSISHELRTPLNAIIGFTDLLRAGIAEHLNPKQAEYIRYVSSSGQHLLNLIGELLDIAKIDGGGMPLFPEVLPVRDLVDAPVAHLATQFADKRIAVDTYTDPGLEGVEADPKRYRQILFNLLANAVKYTPEGGTVSVRAVRQGEDRFTVSVRDNGPGIEPPKLKHLFTEFYQADPARDAAHGGVGIGLSLTRRLVELHGGTIGVDSVVGVGSTFWFTLPRRQPGARPGPAVEGEAPLLGSARKARVLLVEDNDVNAVLMTDLLEADGHGVVRARNGQEALDLAPGARPDIVLMDVMMPVMGGLEATRRLRLLPEFATTPVIALTASSDRETVQHCLAAGCDEHLPKPVDIPRLLETLQRHLAAR